MFADEFDIYLKKIEHCLETIFVNINSYYYEDEDEQLKNIPINEAIVNQKKIIDQTHLDPHIRKAIESILSSIGRAYNTILPPLESVFEDTIKTRERLDDLIKKRVPDNNFIMYHNYPHEFEFLLYVSHYFGGKAPISELKPRYGDEIDKWAKKCKDAFGNIIYISTTNDYICLKQNWLPEFMFLSQHWSKQREDRLALAPDHFTFCEIASALKAHDSPKDREIADRILLRYADAPIHQVLKQKDAGLLFSNDILRVGDFISRSYKDIKKIVGFPRVYYNKLILQCYAKTLHNYKDTGVEVFDYEYFYKNGYNVTQIKDAIKSIKTNDYKKWNDFLKDNCVLFEKVENIELMYKIVAFVRWFTKKKEESEKFSYVMPDENYSYLDYLRSKEIKEIDNRKYQKNHDKTPVLEKSEQISEVSEKEDINVNILEEDLNQLSEEIKVEEEVKH